MALAAHPMRWRFSRAIPAFNNNEPLVSARSQHQHVCQLLHRAFDLVHPSADAIIIGRHCAMHTTLCVELT
jgi:hypothetical protein